MNTYTSKTEIDTALLNRSITAKGLTAKEFAESIGVSPWTIWRILDGKTVPSVKTLRLVSAGLNVSIITLLNKCPEIRTVQLDTEKLKDAAHRSGLSLREIAQAAGNTSHSTIASVLNGKVSPSAIHLKAICDVIGLPITKAFKTI